MSLARGDALALPLRDGSVDLIVTSPPYFALRSYTDDGEHYDGQIGSEATPQDFLEALWAATAEMVRVLKPSGSVWVNLGDKYAGSGGHNNGGLQGASSIMKGRSHTTARDANRAPDVKATRRSAPDSYNKSSTFGDTTVRPKSLMGLPWRYAIGCIDRLGLILRAEVVWSKPNGLPESVTDRVRRSHEQWFHFTREGRYFAAMDELREEYAPKTWTTVNATHDCASADPDSQHAGHRKSAWAADQGLTRGETMNPLGKLPGSVWTIPTEPLRVPDHLPQHFAAFPSEWPRRIILGWSPDDGTVLDPFCGTGTVPAVARALGRTGIGVDLSADYLHLAAWRIKDINLAGKVRNRTFKQAQGSLLFDQPEAS